MKYTLQFFDDSTQRWLKFPPGTEELTQSTHYRPLLDSYERLSEFYTVRIIKLDNHELSVVKQSVA